MLVSGGGGGGGAGATFMVPVAQILAEDVLFRSWVTVLLSQLTRQMVASST